ncbi:MAG TPA: hypothetical protein VH062_24835 [Polyangiaceae bacterium]|jgi:hypothetical protein|nr:hypothetical protein [Polyangiaceae bacterium]
MKFKLPRLELSLDLSEEWVVDETDPKATDAYGVYLRSVQHGVFLNVRAENPDGHTLTKDGLLAILRQQSWASAPFDEWALAEGALTAIGGTFETVGMGGEVVLEVFATDGKRLVNLVGPGERKVIAALVPSVKRLVEKLRLS